VVEGHKRGLLGLVVGDNAIIFVQPGSQNKQGFDDSGILDNLGLGIFTEVAMYHVIQIREDVHFRLDEIAVKDLGGEDPVGRQAPKTCRGQFYLVRILGIGLSGQRIGLDRRGAKLGNPIGFEVCEPEISGKALKERLEPTRV